jgi:Transposase
MDIHRVFAEAVALLDGKTTRPGRADMRRDRLEAFARSTLTHDDHVVVEATGNAAAVAEVLAPHVGRVVIANPKQVRLIAHAKIKTDAIDAAVLAKPYASGFLPVPSGLAPADIADALGFGAGSIKRLPGWRARSRSGGGRALGGGLREHAGCDGSGGGGRCGVHRAPGRTGPRIGDI